MGHFGVIIYVSIHYVMLLMETPPDWPVTKVKLKGKGRIFCRQEQKMPALLSKTFIKMFVASQ